MRAVNLLPDRGGHGGGFGGLGGSRRTLIIAGAVVVLGGMGYMAYSAHSQASDLGNQVQQAQTEQEGLNGQLAALTAVDQQNAALTARKGALVSLASSRIDWERLVRDTVTVLPDGVWLTQLMGTSPTLTTSAPSTPAANTLTQVPAPVGLHVEGLALQQSGVAQLMARLSAVPGLGDARMASGESIQRGTRQVVQFVMDVPIDQRAQDRPTVTVTTPTSATATGVTP